MSREREHFAEPVSQSAALETKSYDDAGARFVFARLVNCGQLNRAISNPKSNLNPLEIVNCFSFSSESVDDIFLFAAIESLINAVENQ